MSRQREMHMCGGRVTVLSVAELSTPYSEHSAITWQHLLLLCIRAGVALSPEASHRLHVGLVKFLLMHPDEVKGDCRHFAYELSGLCLRHAVLYASHIVRPVRPDLAVIAWRTSRSSGDVLVLHQPAVEVLNARLVDSNKEEGWQAVGSLGVPARISGDFLELPRRQCLLPIEHLWEI